MALSSEVMSLLSDLKFDALVVAGAVLLAYVALRSVKFLHGIFGGSGSSAAIGPPPVYDLDAESAVHRGSNLTPNYVSSNSLINDSDRSFLSDGFRKSSSSDDGFSSSSKSEINAIHAGDKRL